MKYTNPKDQDYLWAYVLTSNGTANQIQCSISNMGLLVKQIQTKTPQNKSKVRDELISIFSVQKIIEFTNPPTSYFYRGFCYSFVGQNKQLKRFQYTKVCKKFAYSNQSTATIAFTKILFSKMNDKMVQTGFVQKQLKIDEQANFQRLLFTVQFNLKYIVLAHLTYDSPENGTRFICYDSSNGEGIFNLSNKNSTDFQTKNESKQNQYQYVIPIPSLELNYWYELHKGEQNLMFLYWHNNSQTQSYSQTTDIFQVFQLPNFTLKKRIVIQNVAPSYKKRQLSIKNDGKYVAIFNGKQLNIINMNFQIVKSAIFPAGSESVIKFTQFKWGELNKLYFFHLGIYEGQYSQYKFIDPTKQIVPFYIKQKNFLTINSSSQLTLNLFNQNVKQLNYYTQIHVVMSCAKKVMMLVNFNKSYQIWILSQKNSTTKNLEGQNGTVKKHKIVNNNQKQFSISNIQCVDVYQQHLHDKLLLTMSIQQTPYEKPVVKNVLYGIDDQVQIHKELQIPLHLQRGYFGFYVSFKYSPYFPQEQKDFVQNEKNNFGRYLQYNQLYHFDQTGTTEKIIFEKIELQPTDQTNQSQYKIIQQQTFQKKYQGYKGSSYPQTVKMNNLYMVTVNYYSTTHFLCFNSSTFEMYNKTAQQIKKIKETPIQFDQLVDGYVSYINQFEIPRYFYSLIYDFQLHQQYPQLLFVYWYNSSKNNNPQDDIIQILELPNFVSIKRIVIQNTPLEFNRQLSIRDDGKFFLTFNSKQLAIFKITQKNGSSSSFDQSSQTTQKMSNFQFQLIKSVKFDFKSPQSVSQYSSNKLKIFKKFSWSGLYNKVYLFTDQQEFLQVSFDKQLLQSLGKYESFNNLDNDNDIGNNKSNQNNSDNSNGSNRDKNTTTKNETNQITTNKTSNINTNITNNTNNTNQEDKGKVQEKQLQNQTNYTQIKRLEEWQTKLEELQKALEKLQIALTEKQNNLKMQQKNMKQLTAQQSTRQQQVKVKQAGLKLKQKQLEEKQKKLKQMQTQLQKIQALQQSSSQQSSAQTQTQTSNSNLNSQLIKQSQDLKIREKNLQVGLTKLLDRQNQLKNRQDQVAKRQKQAQHRKDMSIILLVIVIILGILLGYLYKKLKNEQNINKAIKVQKNSSIKIKQEDNMIGAQKLQRSEQSSSSGF